MASKKKTILMISDHQLSSSGVGVQSRFMIESLLRTGKYKFRCLGAAVKHVDYSILNIPPPESGMWDDGDWIIKPIDGFGNKELIRMLIVSEKPDALFIFTDPRFFMHIFEIEDEIHQMCPIIYWNVWDSDPYPDYNKPIYDCIDSLVSHSHLTYSMQKEHYPRARFIPHFLPKNLFFPLPEDQIRAAREKILGQDRVDDFVLFWVGRNAKRKRPGDLIDSWRLFLDMLEKEYGHRNATLLMHTDPYDQEGPNLVKIVEHFNLMKNVVFSTDRVEFPQMNIFHNVADASINTSFHEGFGVPVLESMSTGTPVIAPKTGGITRQIVDHRDGTENGIALDIELRSLVGSQGIPYIYEDYVSAQSFAKAIFKMYEMGPEKRKELGKKALEYADFEFNIGKRMQEWDEEIEDTILNWKERRKFWTCEKV